MSADTDRQPALYHYASLDNDKVCFSKFSPDRCRDACIQRAAVAGDCGGIDLEKVMEDESAESSLRFQVLGFTF
ncbi:MAG: hypothetical protein JO025_09095 [Verrucomicrobia bacterium]|nr:hypothetical protein [Verrucomicrobiota bacterium]